jgi:uncharacterized protein (DUF1501 family)
MTTDKLEEKKLVVIQLGGGNDALNTIIPYDDALYYDNRPFLSIPQEKILPIDEHLGFNPTLLPLMKLWNAGDMAIINGIGYPKPNRSHFRAMDIWHTAEPETIGADGWLGRAIREIDPIGENVVTGVNFGRGLPRALFSEGASVASVGNLGSYGLLPDIKDESYRAMTLEALAQMYGTAGKDQMGLFFSQTGSNALKGADVLRRAPQEYTSSIEYAENPIAQSLKSVAQVLCGGTGTRIFYAQHGSFDSHSAQLTNHPKLWTEVSNAVSDFMDDLREHDQYKNTVILMFSEFGRRVKDNGSGTDHGSGGTAFMIGGSVKGGLYGDYPSIKEKNLVEGDMVFNNDFRQTYATIAEKWLNVDPLVVANGDFEQFSYLD